MPARVRRRVDAAGALLPPPVAAGALTISLALTVPIRMRHATPAAGTPTAG
ncbi:MAG TPA: hypothetical protein VFU81_14055 [Thermomicrobiales bacterium]|nr:hypothetical protein [Thermomicrobiales bacterium]